ncbi:HugZ family pyridoxamine 5'-phosphate oxidase [Amorphus orientalis]|uniref:Heme iron utilization protein n=1 Tax=Amorphus orientalis TaxID=649198 RepID=A0AAE3VSD1_9HYPH|nr:DUF2470 domain-containing protein [Amorphus orientalis]MDQ0316746.1 putative heme iron utilization protein [Amorphus orientalis]
MSSEFEPGPAAKQLLRTSFQGALGTLDAETGAPHVSLVTVATAPDGAPILLLSDLARHTRNLKADDRVSLLASEATTPGDPLALARVTVIGRIHRIASPAADRNRFLARQPEAAEYADFPDFGFYRLEPESAHLVAGFGRIVTLSAADIMTDLSDAQALVEAEPGAIEHMNADHADAVALYAEKLAGKGPAERPWRVCGIDPEGIDLVAGHHAARVDFPERITTPGALRSALKALADQARAS